MLDSGISPLSRWDFPSPSGELWWSGGTNPRFYTWRVSVHQDSPTQHGSTTTQTPREYNCLDIDVDDWIASPTGNVWRVMSVISKSTTEAQLVIEDWNRFNTFKSFQGNATPVAGPFVIFQTNEVGEPLFAELDAGFATARFYAKVDSYFKYLNPSRNITVTQIDHDFKVGDKLSIETDGKYHIATDNNITSYVGNVTQILSSRHFMFEPVTRVVQLKSAYGYSVGTKLYYKDNELTDQKGSKLMYIITTPAIPSTIVGRNMNPALNNGDKFLINDYEVTVGSNVSSIVDFINNDETQSLYTASEVGSPTVTTGTLVTTYGLVGGFVPFSATINGHQVDFTSSTSGMTRYGMPVADENDMIEAITAAGIPNITATVSRSFVSLTNTAGGPITIVNVQNDTNGAPFAGNGSVSGLPINTPASTETAISITRLDGGHLRFRTVDGSANVPEILGLAESRSGRYPQALVVEQGIRKGDTYIVEDMDQRDSLSVLVGDSAFVIDSGNGEWSNWFYTTTGWIMTGNQDSARTDADVLTLIVNHDDVDGELLIGTVSNNSRVIDISVNVIEPFDGDVELNIGDENDNSRLISHDIIDLETVGVYSASPSYVYKEGGDTDLVAYFSNTGSTQGQMKIIISYT